MNVKMFPLVMLALLLLAARQVSMFSMGAPDSACQGEEFCCVFLRTKTTLTSSHHPWSQPPVTERQFASHPQTQLQPGGAGGEDQGGADHLRQLHLQGVHHPGQEPEAAGPAGQWC